MKLVEWNKMSSQTNKREFTFFIKLEGNIDDAIPPEKIVECIMTMIKE